MSGNILAFYSTMHMAMAKSFNTTMADSQMRQVLDDLEVLVDQLDM
jgi:hypothetical protein